MTMISRTSWIGQTRSVELGAEGIGLCRTEHMFFEGDRIDAFRDMICSDTVEEREEALSKILPLQQGDFEKLYETLEGRPVTIRFLDPPLHEFVPTTEEDIAALAARKGKSVQDIKDIIAGLHEFNPMMGLRGCRLAVLYPEIAIMQTKAVIRAAIKVRSEHPDWALIPEIMIPLIGAKRELRYVRKIVKDTADEEIRRANIKLQYTIGTMIEIPRAALMADNIAKEADFFCFGTNDLTQMMFGYSHLHCGICGEHGGDPASIEFCNSIGLDYVSCSPFRVPIARLAAAQAAIKQAK